MKRFGVWASVIAVLGIAVAHAGGIAPGDRVSDFELFDADGKSHRLYKLADKKAIVLMTQGNGCPIVRLAIPALREIKQAYESRGVEVLLINANLQDTAAAVAAEAKEFGFELPILLDRKQTVSEFLGVNRTAEFFVIDPKTWKLAYHGPIDDRLSYEAQRTVKHHYLTDALDAVLAGKPVAKPSIHSPGCLIDFPNRSKIK